MIAYNDIFISSNYVIKLIKVITVGYIEKMLVP